MSTLPIFYQDFQREFIKAVIDADMPTKVVNTLRSCNNHSRCRSRFCPVCNRSKALREADFLKRSILESATVGKRLLWQTLARVDVHANQIATAAKGLWSSFKGLMKGARGILGTHATLEVAASPSGLENVHIHNFCLVGSNHSGRNYMSEKDWRDGWIGSDNSRDYHVELANMKDVEEIGRRCSYHLKTGYADMKNVIHLVRTEPQRYLDRISQLTGSTRISSSGLFGKSMPNGITIGTMPPEQWYSNYREPRRGYRAAQLKKLPAVEIEVCN